MKTEPTTFIFVMTFWLGGGTERVFENVAKALHNSIPASMVALFVVHGFDRQKFALPNHVEVLDSVENLRKFSKKAKNKTVVNFSGDWKSAVVARFVSRKYISWVHCNPFTMKTARTAAVNFWLLRKSERIVCVCKEQKEILERDFGFRNDISVIYNSVDEVQIRNLAKEPLPGIDFKYILMVARMDFNSKDFFTVINAYAVLSESLRNEYKLVFLGDGKDRQKVAGYVAEKGLENSVVLAGYDKNPYRWMKHAAVNILSSTTEGFGLSCVECMCVDCPQIVTDYRTGAREVSENGKNAVLVPIGDARQMTFAIERILTDAAYRDTLVKNASEFVKQFYQSRFEENLRLFFSERES